MKTRPCEVEIGLVGLDAGTDDVLAVLARRTGDAGEDAGGTPTQPGPSPLKNPLRSMLLRVRISMSRRFVSRVIPSSTERA